MAESILACGACLRRAIQLMPHQRTVLESATLFQTRTLQQTQQAFASTKTIANKTPPQTPSIVTNTDTPKSLDVTPEEETVSAKNSRERLQRVVKKQLQYLGDDPWKIAQHVEQTLAKDRYDEALLLTQSASRLGQIVVSWNHLINYLLEKQQLRNAMKLYNEMKKRAQLPNMQTYTIMFRGFAKSQHPKLAVSEAVKQYQKLLKDSRLEPNSTHLNAVLNVCNRAGDLDSMFSIVDTINESTRAPTAYTYTTIINALRFNALEEVKDLEPEQKDANIEKAIGRGKAVWEETIDKWRRGRLNIDEELVCAMGRLLLLSPDRVRKREVLDLIEQTMNIPNLAKKDVPAATKPASHGPKSTDVARNSRSAYVLPEQNTLALVLTTVASSKLTTCGIKYWNLLVREFKVVPDMDAWMRMFGMLKVAKSSAYASEIIAIVPDDFITPRHYCIAMETCVRDNINQNAIKNANRVLSSMMERLRVPDPHTMRLYLRVALVSHFHFRARSEAGDLQGAKRDYGKQITEALAHLWEPYMKLHNHYFNVVKPKTDKDKGILYNNKREVIALARIMYGAFNKVLQQEMLSEEDLKEIRPIGARINREIHTFFSNREELEPNLRKAKGRGTAEKDMSDYTEEITDNLSEWDTTQAGRPRRERRDDGEGRERRNYGERRGRGDFAESRGRRDRDERRDQSEFGETMRRWRRDPGEERDGGGGSRRGGHHNGHRGGRRSRGDREGPTSRDPRQRRASVGW